MYILLFLSVIHCYRVLYYCPYNLEDRGPTVAVGDTAFNFLNATIALNLQTCTAIIVGSVYNPNVQCTTPVISRYATYVI